MDTFSNEEKFSKNSDKSDEVYLIVNTLDATNLERNFIFNFSACRI